MSLLLIPAVLLPVAHADDRYDDVCHSAIVKACEVSPSGDETLCRALTPSNPETLTSLGVFTHGLRDVESARQREFVCARLIGRSLAVFGWATLPMDSTPVTVSAWCAGGTCSPNYADKDAAVAPPQPLPPTDGITAVRWTMRLPTDQGQMSCITSAVRELRRLNQQSSLGIFVRTTAVIHEIDVDWHDALGGGAWQQQVGLSLVPTSVSSVQTAYGTGGLSQMCQTLRAKLSAENQRLLNNGL